MSNLTVYIVNVDTLPQTYYSQMGENEWNDEQSSDLVTEWVAELKELILFYTLWLQKIFHMEIVIIIMSCDHTTSHSQIRFYVFCSLYMLAINILAVIIYFL